MSIPCAMGAQSPGRTPPAGLARCSRAEIIAATASRSLSSWLISISGRRTAPRSCPRPTGRSPVTSGHVQQRLRRPQPPPRPRGGLRGASGHDPRALLRPRVRVRHHPGHRVHRRAPHARGHARGVDPARAHLVGVGRLRLAGNDDPLRRGPGAGPAVHGHGHDADHLDRAARGVRGCARRLRRLVVDPDRGGPGLRGRPVPAPGPVRPRRARGPGDGRGGPQVREDRWSWR